jgi:predicted nucleotidyltransferase component of viral defense system
MILPSEYYEESLYPLQDGVLSIISRSDTDFFLTGGTALSRAYYNHRYSDDLDFFLNKSRTYDEQVEKILALLGEGGFVWDVQENFTRAANFTALLVGYKDSDVLLKLDFVNDLVPHFGGIQETELFCRTDSVRNILSNKLSAVYRYASKDVADIWEIARRESINWVEIIREAKQKEAGLEITYVCEILNGMPQSEFEAVAWVARPEWGSFREDIGWIVREMIEGAGG